MSAEPMLRVAFRGPIGGFTLDAAFDTPARGVTGIFGPSGSGKTTLLRCIAGLQRLEPGLCVIGDEIWQDETHFLPVHRRALGYVFQEASLFPHLDVRRNLVFGCRNGASERVRFDEIVSLLGLEPLLARAPARLSGGERQRVAIGRALLSGPKLLLMDEPLSALDRGAREEILPFLERLHETLATPVLYVSHDMGEIERLADRLVLVETGRVVASGLLADLQSDPALPLFAAREAAVSLDATVVGWDQRYGMAELAVAGGRFTVPDEAAEPGTHRRLRILASDVSLARERPGPSTIVNVLPARILQAAETGTHQVTVLLGLGEDGAGAHLLARVTRRSWDMLGLAPGLPVSAQVKGVALLRRG